MEGTIKIRKNEIGKLTRGINLLKLPVKIIGQNEIPGPLPTGDPDTEVILISEDLSAVFDLGKFFAEEKLSFTL